jgi:hypothetical protein
MEFKGVYDFLSKIYLRIQNVAFFLNKIQRNILNLLICISTCV